MSKDKMSADRQEIAQKIRDGSYFSDANNWYATKYLYPITDRSMAFLFAIAAVIALVPMVFLLKSTVKTKESVAFPIYVADSVEHFSVIKPLASQDETAQEAIAKYLISDYIKSREEYKYSDMGGEKIKRLLKKIKSSSTKQVLNEYIESISENNPNSPIAVYKDKTSRIITIKSFSFLDNDQTSGKAKVIFEAIEQTINEKSKSRSWEVMINFKLPDVESIAKSGAPLRFVISYYRVRPLTNAQEVAPAKVQKPEVKKDEAEAPKAEVKTSAEPVNTAKEAEKPIVDNQKK